MSSRVFLGVTASVSGSLGHSLGMTLQKRAHMRLEALRASGCARKTWKDNEWQFGLALYLLSSTAPPTIALSMLPVFVAAPLAAVGLVANAVFARFILSSDFTYKYALGTLLVTLGSCLVAAFGSIDEPLLPIEELLRLYKRPQYIIFSIVYITCIITLMICELGLRRRYSKLSAVLYGREGSPQPEAINEANRTLALHSVQNASVGSVSDSESERMPLLGAADITVYTPLTSPTLPSNEAFTQNQSSSQSARGNTPNTDMTIDASTKQQTKTSLRMLSSNNINSASAFDATHCRNFVQQVGISDEPDLKQQIQATRYVSGVLSAIASGLICSQTLLLAKSGIGLITLTLRGQMQFKDPLVVAIVVGLVTTALANLYYIQRGLRLCSTLTVVPLTYCSSSLSALASSLVYFDQARLLTASQLFIITLGIIVLIVGVLFLSSKSEDPSRSLPQESDLIDGEISESP